MSSTPGLSGFGASDFGFRVLGVSGLGFRVSEFRFRVLYLGLGSLDVRVSDSTVSALERQFAILDVVWRLWVHAQGRVGRA